MEKQFSQEYRDTVSMKNPRWRAIRRLTFSLTLGRDVLLPFLPAQQADHLTYRHLGRELPFIDLVPLHKGTHQVVTVLRTWHLKTPVNFILRAAFALWLSLWIYLALIIGQLSGIFHGILLPSLDTPHQIVHLFKGSTTYVQDTISGLKRDISLNNNK